MSTTPTVHRTTMVEPDKLAVAAYNPRRISRRSMSALKASITAHGFVEPVVVQATGMVLIGGHQRIEALRQLCAEAGVKLPKVPAVVLDVDDRRARLLNVALNRIGGEFDDAALSSLLSGLGALDEAEVLAAGFTSRDIAALLAPAATEDVQPTTAFARSVTLTVRFDTVEERDAAKALLDERAQRAGKKPGVVLRELLA
jgi:ParB-like chromosome segregation protein Spo0J